MDLVEELSSAADLPLEAVRQAARTPDRIAGGVLRAVGKAGAGTRLSEREENLLFWGVHVLAQARDTRLYRPLLALLRRPIEEVESTLGDAVTGTLPRVLASVFDGDAAPLLDVLSDGEVDEFVRWSLFGGLLYLTFDGRIERQATHDFLVRFDDERLARSGDAAWNGWAETIALMGFEDLTGRYEAALAEARLLDDVCTPDWFGAVMFDAVTNPGDPARFGMHRYGYLGDAAETLDEMLSELDAEGEAEPEEPVVNPWRDVGRNDPCPCGSGKKFKKCCLGKEMANLPAMPSLPPMRSR